jgi:hypothetical protein
MNEGKVRNYPPTLTGNNCKEQVITAVDSYHYNFYDNPDTNLSGNTGDSDENIKSIIPNLTLNWNFGFLP